MEERLDSMIHELYNPRALPFIIKTINGQDRIASEILMKMILSMLEISLGYESFRDYDKRSHKIQGTKFNQRSHKDSDQE
mgnify:CR=1 FL=1